MNLFAFNFSYRRRRPQENLTSISDKTRTCNQV